MTATNIEKALTVLQGLTTRDPDLATRYIHPENYTEHNPQVTDGPQGLRAYIHQLSHQDHLNVVRAFVDGPFVFTQADGQLSDQSTFFDVFRFADGLIVEHWVFSAPAAPANQSGHTQVDGPTKATHMGDTQKNKSFLGEYYQTFHIAGDHRGGERYFFQNNCIRHEPGVRDGVAEFLSDVTVLMQHRTIDDIKLLLGQGDFVFVVARGTHESDPCVYIDLYRVDREKIAEHWGFFQQVPPPEQRKNANGLL